MSSDNVSLILNFCFLISFSKRFLPLSIYSSLSCLLKYDLILDLAWVVLTKFNQSLLGVELASVLIFTTSPSLSLKSKVTMLSLTIAPIQVSPTLEWIL